MKLLQVSNNSKSVFIELEYPEEIVYPLWDFGNIEPAGRRDGKRCVQVWNVGGIDMDKLNEVISEAQN